MTSAHDITRSVNPPRAAFLDYPLGHTTGKPGEAALQREVMLEALEAFVSLRNPGSVKMLPFAWSADDEWKRVAFAGSDDRQPRHPTPQYQTEQDRQRAADCSACGS
jgi:hypothetical protein